ncbi:MAG: polysaccharide deacetylase family protein [Verrucomicrobia bacterium]|nr:polysaccharide deacetylase family protein [Verrucomicrobiota bacterium]
MLPKFALLPLLLALALPTCKKSHQVKTIGETPTPVPTATAEPSTASGEPAAASPGKVAVDQTAQVIAFGYHRFVNQVRRPDTEITPQMFEQQMQELKNRGISVIGMQDFLAWKRGEKNIPPRCAIITFDDGWKSQYDVAWPIMKKFNYPLTLFIYTEGVRGGHFGGGEAITWEQLAEMRDAGVDIEAHSETHSDLRKPYDKIAKKKLNPAEYEQWLHNEIVRCKETLEQRLGIRVNCFAVPYGYYNKHIEEVCMQAGYEALFTVYGQPITFRSNNDSLGRYLIEGNKPKVFTDAISMIATSTAGGAPVAEFGATNLQAKPGDGETVKTPSPLITANLAAFGQIDPGSVLMRVSGLGVVPAKFDPATHTVSYQVTEKLRDKVTVIIEAKSQGKKAEAHWTFAIAENAGAPAAASATGAPKK